MKYIFILSTLLYGINLTENFDYCGLSIGDWVKNRGNEDFRFAKVINFIDDLQKRNILFQEYTFVHNKPIPEYGDDNKPFTFIIDCDAVYPISLNKE